MQLVTLQVFDRRRVGRAAKISSKLAHAAQISRLCLLGGSWRMRMSSVMRRRNGLTPCWVEVMMQLRLKNEADCPDLQHTELRGGPLINSLRLAVAPYRASGFVRRPVAVHRCCVKPPSRDGETRILAINSGW
jgi:hypothetical protein